jgi:hypothetical protein
MNYAQIIAKSFRLGTDVPKLRWFVFFPNIIAVTVLMLQTGISFFLYFEEFGFIDTPIGTGEAVQIIFQYVLENNLLGLTLFSLLIIFLFKFILPPFIQAVLLVGIKEKIENGECKTSLRRLLIKGGGHFFGLFELHAALSMFSLLTVIFGTMTLYRFYHDSLWNLIQPLVWGYIILALIVNIFTFFSQFFVVYENQNFGTSIKKSSGLVFLNFGPTFAIALIMLLVNVRVLINVFVIIGVPMGVMGVLSSFTSTIALGGAIVFGVLLLIFAAYLTAVLEVFSTFVWAQAFLALKNS